MIKEKVRKGLLYLLAFIIVYLIPISILSWAVFTYPVMLLGISGICIVGGMYFFVEHLSYFKDYECLSDFFKATGFLTMSVILLFMLSVLIKGLSG